MTTEAAKLSLGAFSRRFVTPLWPWYAAGVVALAVVNLINLQIPQLAKTIINDFTSGAAPDELTGLALSIAGLGVLLMLIRALSRILIFWPGRRLETVTKQSLFERLMSLPEEFFLKHGMGDLISRIANDVGQIRGFFAFGVLQMLNIAFLTVFTIAKMVSVHAALTACALVPMAVMLVITRVAMPKMQLYSRENQKALGALTNRVTEAFVNVHVIQANAAAASFAVRAEVENEAVYRTNMQLVFIRTVIFPMMSCLAGLSQLIILAYGGYEVIEGRLTVGDILAFNVYVGLLTFPLMALGMVLALYQRCKTAVERIGEIDQTPTEGAGGRSATIAAKSGAPVLEVKNLSFRYPTRDNFGLEGISFTLGPGTRLGVFGRVGSGKSTLFNVLTRLFDPPPGTVLVRGTDVLELSPQALRTDVGYALQQVHLFSDTVRANMTFGLDREVSTAELETAARAAQILDEIEGLKDKWETEIGEKGVRLSGGQKQRLALARLFLRKAPVLLLDDVLSAVDHATEKRLIDHIYAEGCAMVIASHRGSALKRCDEILILEEGRITDRGAYDEIVKRHPELKTELADQRP